MNAYEWRQEARRQRLERAAGRAKAEGERRIATADQMAYQMNGQPILVGHHSEKRHRRQIDKMWNHSAKGFARLKEAQELARRAAAVGTGGVSSDDPDGPAKLGEKLVQLQAHRDRVKQINAAYRKAKGAKGWSEGLNLTHDETQAILRSLAGWNPRGVPFPPYVLTNLGARVRDTERRIADLEQRQKVTEALAAEGLEVTERTVNGVTIEEDWPENRISLRFPRRLSREEYKGVRSAGFVWSPTRNAFVRKLNSAALDRANWLVSTFTGGGQ